MTEQDVLRRFIFEDIGVRGTWVNLTQSWQASKRHQKGPENAQLQLGQALAAVVMLSSTIKFKGSMILQAQGDGDLKALVAQSTDDKKIRGLLRSEQQVPIGTLETQFGQGRLVLTIEPDDGNPYQGIVPLQGKNLAAAVQTYFEQSEQLNTRLWLFANETSAAGLLIQELPAKNGEFDDWQRIELFANTITEQEALTLDCEELLYKLFNEEHLRLFDSEPVSFECSCSKLRIERTLRAMGREELESILLEFGNIEVDCEFCNEHYNFDSVDIESLLTEESLPNNSETQH